MEKNNLSDSMKFTIKQMEQAGISVSNKLCEHDKTLTEKERKHAIQMAFRVMQKRMINAVSTLGALTKLLKEVTFTHDPTFDAVVILRAMYDLHLQFLCILLDPLKNARAYLNFSAVEVFRQMEIIRVYSPGIQKGITNWPAVVQKVTADFDKVQDDYAITNSKGKQVVRPNWYVGQLDGIARQVGYEPEYRMVQKTLSAVVHSSSASLMMGFIILDCDGCLHDGWCITLRVCAGIAKHLKIPLTPVEQLMYDHAREPLYE
jgi:hypothetical protein